MMVVEGVAGVVADASELEAFVAREVEEGCERLERVIEPFVVEVVETYLEDVQPTVRVFVELLAWVLEMIQDLPLVQAVDVEN